MNENYYEQINPHLLAGLQDTANQRVLEIGCASGQLGAAVKEQHPVHWTGIGLTSEAYNKAKKVLDVAHLANIETDTLDLERHSFDRLVLGDVLEHLRDPWSVLEQLKSYLKPEARVICSLPNINHWSILTGLLAGDFTYQDQGILDRTHLRFFTLKEGVAMFQKTGFQVDRVESIEVEHEQMQSVVRQFNSLRNILGIQYKNFEQEARTYQWLIHARNIST